MTDDWSRCPLSAVAPVIKRGRAPSYADEGILVLNQKCVRPGNVIDYSVARRTDPSVKAIPEWAFLQVGDVLVNSTGRGTAGRAALVAQVRERATVDSHVTIVRSDTDLVVPAFVGIVLSSMPDTLEQLATGSTTQVELSRESIGQVILRLPPLSQQRRIVDLIGSIDTYIDCLESQLGASEATHAAVIRDMFDNQDWEYQDAAISTLLTHTIGGVWGNAPGAGDVDVAVLRSTNFTQSGIPDLADVAVRSISEKQLASRKLRDGDILLEKSGGGPKQPVGRVVQVSPDPTSTICANFVQLLRCDQSKVLPRFLFLRLWLDHKDGVTERFQAATTGIRNLRTKDYLARRIQVPGLSEQSRIVQLADALDAQVEGLRIQIRSAHQLRDGVLSELLCGERLLDDSYDTAVGL